MTRYTNVWLLVAICVTTTVHGLVRDKSNREAMIETMPGYTVLTKTDLLNSTECRIEMEQLRDAIDRGVLWALKILDMSGMPTSHFVQQGNYWVGSRLGCQYLNEKRKLPVSAQEERNNSLYRDTEHEFPPFPIRYYVAQFHHNSTMQYHLGLQEENQMVLGLCLPATCTTDEIAVVVEKIFHDRTLLVGKLYAADFKLDEVKDLRDDHRWLLDGKHVVMILALLLVAGMTVAGTVYDLFVYQKRLKRKRDFLAFENNNTSGESIASICIYCSGNNWRFMVGSDLERPSNIITNPSELFDFFEYTNTIHRFFFPKLKNNDAEAKREPDPENVSIRDLRPQSTIGKFLICFSGYSNLKQIFNIESGTDNIAMLHGVKFFGMTWIIAAHTIYYGSIAEFSVLRLTNFSYSGDRTTAVMMTNAAWMQVLTNATYSVDTFFCVSGFLLGMVYLKSIRKEKPNFTFRNFTKIFLLQSLKRFIRLTPAYAIVIIFTILNFTSYDKVSTFHFIEEPVNYCTKYWWRNLLYINNFYDWNELCFSWSWYIANDMQFFMFGTILLVLFSTHFFIAAGVTAVTMLSSCIIIGYKVYVLEYVPTLDQLYKTLTVIYIRPWMRIGPFIVGILTAILLEKWKYKLNLSTKARIAGWTFGVLCNCSILFGIVDKNIPLAMSVLYVSLSRTFWAFGIAWLIIACTTNNGGIVNKFLSLRAWIPMGRLTFCAYLLNPFILTSIFMYGNYPVYVDFLNTTVLALGVHAMTYASSLVLSVMAEAPAILLLRLYFNTNRRMK
ncbi:PREDICTED: nose resistant to fluoxetine protein 6-like [Dufourea novaeangliae]|uniref:nose resistant to fluoxetine protein 6-like n=1 Tax=Dufourea novaeangliae TaxID=178035 RepID=UPI0007672991|nr:PREDICTED: nose resistant to fluoxetine protein 6-like [Dufourea novaeangliae]